MDSFGSRTDENEQRDMQGRDGTDQAGGLTHGRSQSQISLTIPEDREEDHGAVKVIAF